MATTGERLHAEAAFLPVEFDDLPGWEDDDHRAAFQAFRRCALHVRSGVYRSGALGVAFESFGEAYTAARAVPRFDAPEARAFFEHYFQPCRVLTPDGTGFVTGYYEPELQASRERGGCFTVPLYAWPDDLVEIDAHNRPADMDPEVRFGRRQGSRIEPYFDRQAIEQGALAGRGLEIAWLADRVDAFFVHVQGAARLKFADGSATRITFAAKSGHEFTAPGRILVEMGAIPREKVTMQTIRAWLYEHPERVNEILWQNRSFIFFRETLLGDPNKGPVAAAKVQLEPGRSLAVDRVLHTFGTPFYIDAPDLTALGGGPFRRLMIAQDTGSAIQGAARGDIFVGVGAAAGEMAGVVRHAADFYALLPRMLFGAAR